VTEFELLKEIIGFGIGAVFGLVCFFWYTKAVKEHRLEIQQLHMEHEKELKQLIAEKAELHKQDIACQKEVAIVLEKNSLLLQALTELIRNMNGNHRVT
jgi:hypothetical protein